MRKQVMKAVRFLLRFLNDKHYSQLRYIAIFRSIPNLHSPSSFNEHVLARMIFLRDPLMRRTADKVDVRSYVEEHCGPEILTKVFCVISDLNELSYETLPESFVMKPTHASGEVKVIHDKNEYEEAELLKVCRAWLKLDYYKRTREWVYKDLPRRVIFEECLIDENGRIPADYKFYCFDGEPRFLSESLDRFSDPSINLYDTAWRRLPFRMRGPTGPDLERPKNFARMIEICRSLSQNFGFVRVDLYDLGDRVVFGELTHYPGAGHIPIYPHEYDLKLGRYFHSTL